MKTDTNDEQVGLETRQEHEIFRLLVDAVTDYAIFAMDIHGHILTWNKGAERLNGYSSSEIIGKHFSIFYTANDIHNGKTVMELRVAKTEGRYEEEGWRVKKDGSLFWANVVITSLNDEKGRLIGFTKVTRDLTERRNAEIKLRDLNESLERKIAERTKELTEAVKSRDEFLSMASHELNTPLTTLKLKTQLRQRSLKRIGIQGFTEQKLEQMFEEDQIHVNRLGRLVDDMLDIARLGSGKLSIRPVELDMDEHISEIINRFAPQLTESGCKITYTAQKNVHGLLDPYRVEQIFSNLLTNAMKYGAGNPILVNIASDAHFAVICVHDQGRGISTEDQERIFQQFERAAPAEEIGGLGLGLYIVKKIVDLHGGSIKVESELGKGSTFCVKLPLK